MKFHAISAKLPQPFSNRDKDLVLQFSVKHEEHSYSFCGGGYIKLLPSGLDQTKFGGDSPYYIMFGPDLCGYDVSRIHVIFNHEGENLLKTDDIKLEYNDKNENTHLYTLVVHPDNTYEVLFDQQEKSKGSLFDGWKYPPKTLDDPTDKKPSDWVDEEEIVDPNDKKPDGWDDIPKQIPDPSAKKPDDWDEEADGEYEAPLIDNPEYKGEWKAKKIPNPAYKGPWKAKQIPNPNFKPVVYAYDNIEYVGFELWTVNKGSVFDNIYIGDSVAEATELANKFWKPFSGDKEKAAKEDYDKKKKDAEKKEEPATADDDDDDDEKTKSKDEL